MANPGETTARSTFDPPFDASAIADRVKDAASAASSTLGEGRAAATDALKAAADSVSATTDYLRDTDMQRMASDVEDVVRKHPGPALLVAGALGFLVGRALSR